MGGCGSKVRKVSTYRLAESNETILVTRQEIFFAKAAPVQGISNIILLDLWLMLLSCMFISSYTLHCHSLFRKEIYFFECLYFSEYDIQMSLNVFGWEKGHQLSTDATGGEMDGCRGRLVVRGMQNAYSCVQWEGLPCLMCTYAFTLFSCFWQHFFVFVLETESYLYSKKVCSSETVIFLQQDQFLSKAIFANQS